MNDEEFSPEVLAALDALREDIGPEEFARVADLPDQEFREYCRAKAIHWRAVHEQAEAGLADAERLQELLMPYLAEGDRITDGMARMPAEAREVEAIIDRLNLRQDPRWAHLFTEDPPTEEEGPPVFTCDVCGGSPPEDDQGIQFVDGFPATVCRQHPAGQVEQVVSRRN